MTETSTGDGTKDDIFRIIKHFWKKENDKFILLYSIDTYYNSVCSE